MNSGALQFELMSVEELIDARRRNLDYLAWLQSEMSTAANDTRDLDSMLTLRMEEKEQRKFERAGFKGEFKKVKRGSASVLSPVIAKAKLEAVDDVPRHVIADVFTTVVPEPVLKVDLRKFRKVAEYGAEAAAVVRAFISEPLEFEVLVIEEIKPMLNVTPDAAEAVTA
jgi:hypothetical protein